MSAQPKILAFAGSLRRDSFNKKLVQLGAQAARDGGAEVMYLDLRDLPMPILDQDIEKESGLPENAKTFKQLMLAHSGLLISSPEYNSMPSAALKNAIDWASRAEPGEAPLACFKDKVCGLMSASPGALGGLRALPVLRNMLLNINVLVIPEYVSISKAHEAFDETGKLKDAKQAAQVTRLAGRLVQVLTKLAS